MIIYPVTFYDIICILNCNFSNSIFAKFLISSFDHFYNFLVFSLLLHCNSIR
jgi:hypothetical protein